MTRERYFQEARTRLEQAFVDHLKAEKEALCLNGRPAEEIETLSEFLWRSFEQESERIIQDSWLRYQRTFH